MHSVQIFKRQNPSKGNFDTLIVCEHKIYYLNITSHPDMWVINEIFLMEEIPPLAELNQRLQVYQKVDHYEKVADNQLGSYIKKFNFFLSLFLINLDHKTLMSFPNIYAPDGYHPDLVGVYLCLGNQLPQDLVRNKDGIYRRPHLRSRVPHLRSRVPHLRSRVPHLRSRVPLQKILIKPARKSVTKKKIT
jgi:hypothetical protein